MPPYVQWLPFFLLTGDCRFYEYYCVRGNCHFVVSCCI
uniref:Uncharacterized protein n=1 Tax=Arundo donax TaxID=35708 RepID=A0A0A9BK88_ARUDO